jgi:hypothetical protein
MIKSKKFVENATEFTKSTKKRDRVLMDENKNCKTVKKHGTIKHDQRQKTMKKG